MSNKDVGSQPIPTSTTGQAIPHHWWFDRPRSNSVGEASSPTGHSGSFFSQSPTTTSYSSTPPDPKVAIPLPSAEDWTSWRRDSMKYMYQLNDFATD